MIRPLTIVLAAWLFMAATPQAAVERRVNDDRSLRAALANIEPGVTVLIAPGRYRGGIVLRNVSGTAERPIVIAGADPNDPPVFGGGGGQAFHLSNCRFVTLRHLVVRGFTANGINVDDGGDFDTPAEGIVLEDLRVLDTGPQGNCDGIKLSGVVDFAVRRCHVEGWGGSAVDMVGCHRGVIEDSRFIGKPGHSNHSGVQAKGGSSNVLVQTSFFTGITHRSINLGGSTGDQYFRPKGLLYEAKDIEIAGNRFVGSMAPVAFVTSQGSAFRYNTIVNPERWALRILQERPVPPFEPCRGGVFEHNLIVTTDRSVPGINVGPNTEPRTFVFRNNLWHVGGGGRRVGLPAPEEGGVIDLDPELKNPETAESAPQNRDARLDAVGAHAWPRVRAKDAPERQPAP